MIKKIKDITILKDFNIEQDNNPFINYLGYIENNDIVAYLSYNLLYDRVDIVNIFVKEEFRNRKIASNMLEYLINICKEKKLYNITLEVKKTNEHAIKLYKKYNFKEVAIRKGYYQGIDGILMELIL